MFSLGISNLRRLKHVEPIAFKPITVLVGRNSSGKSSFLRSLPLLRQSLLTRTSSPILWYGDYVDFGDYTTAVRDNSSNHSIVFSFTLDHLYVGQRPYRYGPVLENAPVIGKDIKVDLTIIPQNDGNRISSITMTMGDPRLQIALQIDDKHKVTFKSFNGNQDLASYNLPVLVLSPGSIFPEIHVEREEPAEAVTRYYRPFGAEYLNDIVANFLRPHLHKKIGDDTLNAIAFHLANAGLYADAQLIEEMQNVGPKSFREFFSEVMGSDRRRLRPGLRNVLALSAVPELLNRLFAELRQNVMQTLYIGPARARSERYYRYQDLSVSEIDSDGKNFPMFLNSLNTSQVRKLSSWIEGLFGYGIDVAKAQSGHISIKTVVGNVQTNVVDTGYGVSQILPVLAQIWWARERPQAPAINRARTPLIAIEQPELHLHPAHQALLADAMVGEVAAPKNGRKPVGISFLVETHSETLINRLGELIAAGSFPAQDIQIVIFEADSDDLYTVTQLATFSEDGALNNWPYGFFQPV